MPNLNELLKQKASEVKPPKPVPVGTYRFQIIKHEFGKSSQKKTDFVAYTCRAIEAREDVDQSELAEYGGLSEVELDKVFYLTPAALFQLTEFLVNTMQLPDKELDELIPEAVKGFFIGVVEHEETQRRDGTKGSRAVINQTGPDA